jgi:hypothetical protein
MVGTTPSGRLPDEAVPLPIVQTPAMVGTLAGATKAASLQHPMITGRSANNFGAPPDQVYIAINGGAITGGSVASPADLTGGNIQAHFDQPHK